MGWDIKLSARKGNHEEVFIDYGRIGYVSDIREFFGRFNNCEEHELNSKQIKELLDIVYPNISELSDSWKDLFILPFMLKDGYKVFVENSY